MPTNCLEERNTTDAPTVSIVLCTYNGERFLRQQIDTVLAQTYPLKEIIIQDDHSTDSTPAILAEYAAADPRIKVFTNASELVGVNSNFFTAMRRAEGDYIALCDQDDLWEPTKIEKQMAAVQGHLLCTCRSKPFTEDGSPVVYDPRTPNYDIIRLLYASIPGHTLLFHHKLLRLLPDTHRDYGTCYDVVVALTAASYQRGLVLADEVLVRQRRYATAASYLHDDKRRTHASATNATNAANATNATNALQMLAWSLRHYHTMMPLVSNSLKSRRDILGQIAPYCGDDQELRQLAGHLDRHFADALTLAHTDGKRTPGAILRTWKTALRCRHFLFFTEEHGPLNLLRALLFPVMHLYNYRHLLEKKD